jgi:putative transposase
MKKMDLSVTQRVAYKVTTKRRHGDNVADNLLNQNFNLIGPNQVWAGDITYLLTGEGWSIWRLLWIYTREESWVGSSASA